MVSRSIVKQATISESVVLINEGGGKFTVSKLPERAQLSCICGVSCLDINRDGHLDLVMAGNNFEFKPQFSRLDAGYGNVLLGDGKMGFQWQDYAQSGFTVRGEVKHLGTLTDSNGRIYLVAAINEENPRIFQINE